MNKKPKTICIIATPPGYGGIGIIKISGPFSLSILKKIFRSKSLKKLNHFPPRQLVYGFIVNPQNQEKIDEVLVSYMPAPYTYTREDVVEINSHANFLILEKILNLVLDYGARLAEPGEFTRRAFLNGRLDLTQAEAVCDLVKAQSEADYRRALLQLSAGLSDKIKKIKSMLIDLIARLEAQTDFVDAEVPLMGKVEIKNYLKRIKEKIEGLIKTSYLDRIYREGILIALVGLPNVGKSSLFNALLQEERAIVTHIPGTTRDLIEENISIEGIMVKLVDTAGITKSALDKISKIAIKKAERSIKHADLVLMVFEANEKDNLKKFLQKTKREVVKELKNKPCFLVANKIDLVSLKEKEKLKKQNFILVSAKTGEGIEKLKQRIRRFVLKTKGGYGSTLAINMRHKNLLEESLKSLKQAEENLKRNKYEELIVYDLNEALSFLLEITGEKFVHQTEEVLDHIFKNFCVGK